MSFAGIETSRQKGEPITLYEFIYGGVHGDSPSTLTTFAYTDSEDAVISNDIVYLPEPMMRPNIVSSGTLDKSALPIRMPRDVPLADLFIVHPPAQVVQLIIWQGHVSDISSEFLVVWAGRVLSVAREGDECVVTAEPISSSLRRPGLRRHYQLGCPHALYRGLCPASEAAATVTSTVSAINGTTITLPSGWEGTFDPAKFTEGMVKWINDDGGEEARKILRVTGNDLLLGGLLRDLAVSSSVSVILGCNHLMDDCEFLHNVIQNFGGMPWIPAKNPVGFRNQYY